MKLFKSLLLLVTFGSLTTACLVEENPEEEVAKTLNQDEHSEDLLALSENNCHIANTGPIKYHDLLITGGGNVTLNGDNDYDMSIEDPRGRATVNNDYITSLTGGIEFRFNGPSNADIPLGSGTMRRQIGLKLMSGNTCNLIYAMWRIEPEERMVVQMKSNPGMTTHDECTNNGYSTLVPDETKNPFPPVSSILDGEYHSLFAQFEPIVSHDGTEGNNFKLTICADGLEVWAKEIYDLPEDIKGTSGFRTDNGNFDFRFYSDVSKDGDYWLTSYAALADWTVLRASDVTADNLGIGDFDGNGKTDVFTVIDGGWYVSLDGTSDWEKWNSSGITMGYLRFGDFDGNGTTDVFRASETAWYVSLDGNSKWQTWNTLGASLDQIAFGDFDGDERTDAFTTDNGKWMVSPGAQSAWEEWNSSSLELNELKFGDFDGDGKTDVFRTSGSTSYISSGGSSKWLEWSTLDMEADTLNFGDFDGDGKTDIVKAVGGQLHLSSEGRQAWSLLPVTVSAQSILMSGDFNGDGKSDLFTVPGMK